MKETLKYLRAEIGSFYDRSETEAIIRIIFHYLKGWNLTDILIHSDDILSPFVKNEIEVILQRLKKHEPIQYITREARFYGMNFTVKPGVLIPRPETEGLVDLIIDKNRQKEDLKVLDICTGSGCIAISIARNLKFAQLDAIDISEIAIDIARKNAADLKTKVNFIQSDIFHWLPEKKYDIIVSNPPYVDKSEATAMDRNVLDYEPENAIFVPDDNPLLFYDRIGDIAKTNLYLDGILYLEINPRHQEELGNMMKDKGFKEIHFIRDSFGKQRFMICKK